MAHQPFLALDPLALGLPAPLSADITLLDRLFGEVLAGQDAAPLLDIARRLYTERDQDPRTLLERYPELNDPLHARDLIKAFTVLFRLLNTAEQKEIVRVNRSRRGSEEGGCRPESIEDAVMRLARGGLDADGMQRLLDRLDICPTLTAHPTEARRREVMDKLQSIARQLVERAHPPDLPLLDRPLDMGGVTGGDLLRTLTELWQTAELRPNSMTVADEVANALYFVEHTIMGVVAWLHDDLRRALERAYPGVAFEMPPFIRYRSWVGGDRDGNPNVTPQVTWQTLLHHQRLALGYYLERTAELRSELTMASRLSAPNDELLASIERDQEMVGLPQDLRERHAPEPYVLKLLYVEARLIAAMGHLDTLADYHAEGPSFMAHPPAYTSSTDLLEDLAIMQRSLRAAHAGHIADEGPLAHFATQVRTFGFHLATLDVRQHSEVHERVLEEMLAAAGVLPPERPYSALPEADKVRLLSRELHNPRPLTPHDWHGSEEAESVLQSFEVIRHARRYISPHAVTAYIISMTHGISDMLEVLLLAKESGLLRWRMEDGEARLESDIDVVPLFETIEDLQQCEGLMRRVYANDAYRTHLRARGDFQEIMLGYSDSNKDGGYLAANWALHDTQARLAKVTEEAGIAHRFFHGRGGTVGRGGGRANRAILSQAPGSFNGRIRFTEQGEVISFRYSLAPIAHRHLEQIVSAVLMAASEQRMDGRGARDRERRDWQEAMRQMAERSRIAFRKLVYDDPEFWSFYTQATPIRHISRLPITSRPTFRSGKPLSGLEDLRAIPWVFAWVQSRYVLPGWFGVGGAFEWFAGEDPSCLDRLRAMYRDWPFFRTVIDNAQLELTRTHLRTAAWYAARVQPPELGERMHREIEEEYERTCGWVLQITGQEQMLENAPVVRRTVELRNPAVEPLNRLQVALLERWDHLPEPERTGAWRDAILLSIAGIAAAMQSTG